MSVEYSYQPDIESSDVEKVTRDFNVLVLRSKINVDQEFLDMNPQLELIARAGSGMDNIDVEAAHVAKVHCINTPEANCDAVGEQTVGMLLALATNMVKGNNEITRGVWDREGNRGFELGQKTVGIIGYGHTGSAVARKLSGFGCRILAYDKYKEGFGNEQVEEVGLSELLEESDVITFHVPLTAETKGWIDRSFVESVRKDFVLLNLSRGGIMNTADVIDGLSKGKIRSFGSDVLENEKLSSMTSEEKKMLNELTGMDQVILTPHVGGWTSESYRKISEVLAVKIGVWLDGNTSEKKHFGRNRQFVR